MTKENEIKLRNFARAGKLDEIKKLLTSDPSIDLDAVDDQGNTSLMLAVQNYSNDSRDNTKAIAEFLIKNGANTEIRNSNNETAMDFYSEFRDNELLMALNDTLPLPNNHMDKYKSSLEEDKKYKSIITEENTRLKQDIEKLNVKLMDRDLPVTDRESPISISSSPPSSPHLTLKTPISSPVASHSPIDASFTPIEVQDKAVVLTPEQQEKIDYLEKLKKMAKMLPEGAVRQRANDFKIKLADGDITAALKGAEEEIINPKKIVLTQAQEEAINKFVKMAKMPTIGAVIQKASTEGFKLPADVKIEDISKLLQEQMLSSSSTNIVNADVITSPKQEVKKAIIPLEAADYIKPLDEVRAKINSYAPEFIMEQSYIQQSIEARNGRLASMLVGKLADAKTSPTFSEEQRKEAVESGVVSLIENLKKLSLGATDENGKNALDIAEERKTLVDKKYEDRRNLSVDAEEFREARKVVVPEKPRQVLESRRAVEEARVNENYRQALIHKTYPTLKEDESKEKKSADELYANARGDIDQRISSIKSAVTNAVKKGVVAVDDIRITRAIASIEDPEIAKQIREGINAARGAKQSGEKAKEAAVASPAKKSSQVISDDPSH